MRKWLYKGVIRALVWHREHWSGSDHQPGKLVVDRKDRLGDLAITLPLIEALSKEHLIIEVACSQHNIDLSRYVNDFSGDVCFLSWDKVSLYPEFYLDLFYKEWSRALKRIWELKPKYCYGFCKSPKYGLSSHQYALFDRCVPFNDSLRVIENQRLLFNQLYGRDYDFQQWRNLFPGFRVDHKILTAEKMRDHDSTYDMLLSLQGSSSFRQLSLEGVVHVARSLAKLGIKVVVPWTGEIPPEAEELFLPTPKLQDFISAIGESRVVVSVDSAAVHLASLLNIPVIGIYMHHKCTGSRFHPFSDRHALIYRERLDILKDTQAYTELAGEIMQAWERLQCGS